MGDIPQNQIIIDKYVSDISALTGEDCGNSTIQVLRLVIVCCSFNYSSHYRAAMFGIQIFGCLN